MSVQFRYKVIMSSLIIKLPTKSHISIIKQIIYIWGPFGHRILNLQDYDSFFRFFLNINLNEKSLILTCVQKKNCSTIKLNSWERQKTLKRKSFTIRSLILSAISGVTYGFKSSIKCEGIGFRLLIEKGDEKTNIRLKVGFSHDILVTVPNSIIVFSMKKTKNECFFFSVDSQNLMNFVNFLSRLKKYNPYKKTGILIKDKLYHQKNRRKR